MQERHNSIANALELCLSCINPLICCLRWFVWHSLWFPQTYKLRWQQWPSGAIWCQGSWLSLYHCLDFITLQWHYNGPMASQITSLPIVYSAVYSGADQRKHQRSVLLAFVRGIHWWPVNSPHKGPVTWKMFPFDHVIMKALLWVNYEHWMNYWSAGRWNILSSEMADIWYKWVSEWLSLTAFLGSCETYVSEPIQVLGRHLFGASHYLNQCWFIVK